MVTLFTAIPVLQWSSHMLVDSKWCVIYVDTTNEDRQLARTIADGLDGSCEDRCVTVGTVELDVESNDDFDAKARLVRPEGFLHFRYRVEIDYPTSKAPEVLALVSRLLTYLWGNEIAAVAACDFEDDLPHLGGGQLSNSAVPWPK